MTRSKLVLVMIAAVAAGAVGCNKPNQEIAKQMVPVPGVEQSEAPGAVNPQAASTELQFGEGLDDANGVVTFTETGHGVKISAQVSGLQPGVYSLHLHENGECSAPDFASVGGPFNPHAEALAEGEEATERAVGDLGDIEVGDDGNGTLETESKRLTVSPGPASVVGRSVVLDSGSTDESAPAGEAPTHTACGVVLLLQPPAAAGEVTATQPPTSAQ